MELKSKNNLFLWFYRYQVADSRALPSTICPLFWLGLLGMVCFILSPIVNLWSLFFPTNTKGFLSRAEESGNGIRKVFINLFVLFQYFLSTMFGNIILFGEQEEVYIRWYEWFYLWSIVPIIIILIGGVIFLIIKMSEAIQDTKLPTPQSAKVFKEGVSNWYNKWCTKIDWK